MSQQLFDGSSLHVAQRGMARDRKPIFSVLRVFPSFGRNAGGELELRCMDLWRDACAVDQGCSYTQFLDDPEHLRCYGCGLKLSKFYLRSNLLISISSIPADYKAIRR